MCEALKLLNKEGNSLVYNKLDGTIIKKFRKGWEANDDGCLDAIMDEFERKQQKSSALVVEEVEEEMAE
jgi:hypothetical protein